MDSDNEMTRLFRDHAQPFCIVPYHVTTRTAGCRNRAVKLSRGCLAFRAAPDVAARPELLIDE